MSLDILGLGRRRLGRWVLLLGLVGALVAQGPGENSLFRARLEPGLIISLVTGPQGNLVLGLEAHIPEGVNRQDFYKSLVAGASHVETYSAARNVMIPFARLSGEYQRAVLLGLFEADYVDAEGWHHTVTFADADHRETLYSLCEWITGKGLTWHHVSAVNKISTRSLKKGDVILFPASVLPPVMARPAGLRRSAPAPDPPPTPPPAPPAPPVVAPLAFEELDPLADGPVDLPSSVADGPLTYGEDGEGLYGEYRIRRGEALYSAVVVRFTNYKENEDVLDAVKVIQGRSGIVDVRDIDTGMAIRIPEDMLSAQYKLPDSADRRDYEAVVAESARLRQAVPREVHARDLEGIVVVLDPGHGSRDVGKQNPGKKLYEDEINYDIMCRVMDILERETRAKVYVTMRDPSSGYTISDRKRFASDNDEVVLSTPPYPRRPEDYDSKVSANLRFYVANDIYDREVKSGTDSRKIVFTSFHIDSLHKKLRGAMIYIPGAKARSRRPGSDHSGSAIYRRFKEVRPMQTTAAERRRDEALSRAFAETLYDALGARRVKRHDVGPAIRSEIRQRGNRIYVPAVIRGNKIPTKILLEAANMNNARDRKNMADPEWRQFVAEAYVDALKTHYGTS